MTPRLLVIDDDSATRLLLSRLFTKRGWQVDTADNGTAAIEQARGTTYDCVLIDCHLPEMDGTDVARALRELNDGHCPPLVGVSAGDPECEKPQCLKAGMSDYVAKPFVLTTLVERLEDLMTTGRTPDPAAVAAAGEPFMQHDVGENPQPALDLVHFHGQIQPFGGVSSTEARELVDVFLESCTTRLEEIEKAIDRGDVRAIGDLGHAIRGAAGNLGAVELATRATEFEVAGRRGSCPGDKEIARLSAALNRCRAVLYNTLDLPNRDFGSELPPRQ
jgi:CheY-like chemotaxis protein/HPt (histidine-containing phosphotransfer) domain-containing protein